MSAVTGAVATRFDEEALKRGSTSVRHPLARALLTLTFTTGLIDAVSYLALGRVFTANMTGNIVLLGFGIAGSGGLPVVAPIVSLAAFLLGAGIGGALVKRMRERHPSDQEIKSRYCDHLQVAGCPGPGAYAGWIGAAPAERSGFALRLFRHGAWWRARRPAYPE